MIYFAVCKVSVVFKCTDSFWPLTCKKIQIGAHASVHIKTIILLYDINSYASVMLTDGISGGL